MFRDQKLNYSNKESFYKQFLKQAEALIKNESDFIANLANISALIFYQFPQINWSGFYLLKDNELVLGPFQGKPACVRIQIGKGVCGTSVQKQHTIIVPDVHIFPGHIACDNNSNSEIVIPLILNNVIIGVLDIDSPIKKRFDEQDATNLEILTHLITDFSEV